MSLDEKVGDLKLDEKKPDEATEEVKESVLEELKESPPKLEHVETKDTTDPSPGDSSTADGVVKAEVPEAFQEELKKDHDIVPESKETGKVVETKTEEAGPEAGDKEPATREVPTSVVHEVVDDKVPAKTTSIGEKISATFQKIVGKDKE